MKISLKWLSDYVPLPEPSALAHQLTMAGLEVEGITRRGEDLRGVVVGQIVESKPHPNADKLSVTRVDAGGPAPLQIVCGAKNYRVGDKVPLATIGTKLPAGAEIKQAALRGVESFGMLCSAKELGLAEEASGLLILDPSAQVGAPIAQALGIDDTVFEVNVTPNRPDALSHLGVAREVAVLSRAPLAPPRPTLREAGGAAAAKAKVRIEDPVRCPRYGARVIEGVTIRPSPAWLAQRLEACGVRAINNVVDVTNYVLLEYGQPLHAFDLDKLAGAEIVVRTAPKGERLTTLDGQERRLEPDDLVIADREKAHVLAGVMGGAESEVSGSTRRILLECAHFQPSAVRRASKRHGLHTESSHRFERGTDVSVIPAVLDRAAALIAELAGGTVLEGRIDVYPRPVPQRTVPLRYDRVGAILGTEVAETETDRILTALGFERRDQKAGQATYAVPYARVDVDREEDLIEEVARIYGYDRIPAAMPRSMAVLGPEPREAEVERRMRHALAGAGFDEVVNYSFVAPEQLAALGEPVAPITLVNPLSVEQSGMRTTLVASLLLNVARNRRHQAGSMRLYELARVYIPDPDGGAGVRPVAREGLRIAGVLYGLRDGRTWTAKEAPVDFFDAKGAVEALLSALHIQGASFEPFESPRYHPRASATVSLGGAVVGSLGEIHPRAAQKLDVPPGTFVFELDAEALARHADLVPSFKPLSRFPAVFRDLAVVVPVELRNEDVRKLILEVGAPLVDEASVFDVYTGKPIPEGQKNLAYALRYQAPDRTLTDAEVNEAHQRIVAEVQRRLGGRLRS